MKIGINDQLATRSPLLRMKYDDGFVAYVNGTRVASANAPASPTYASYATASHTGTAYETFTILNAGDFLQTGDNVLAIHGLNLAGDTNDFFISPLLTGIAVGDLQTNSVMYYTTPTPGADNVFGVLGFVGDTTFTVDRGFFTNAFKVEIACETEGSQIYYTTDGTTPATDNGTLYRGPISIGKTTVLRAAAFKTGWQPSDTDTQTYLFLNDIIAQGTSVSGLDPYFPPSPVNGQGFDYGMDPDIINSATYSGQIKGALLAIPSISMVTDPDNLFDASSGIYVNASEEGEAWERETSIELINPDGTKGFQINGGLRIRGETSTSSSNPKHSFRFFFDSAYGTSRLNYPLFGDDGEGFSLTLINPYAATNTWSESSAWRPSKYSGGTPGEGDYHFPSPGDLVINEALTHQDDDTPGDWVELCNTSTNTLDINGWFLSDNEGNLAMVQLSGLATIAPGGYLVLTEAAHFGANAAGTNGFALSELGESIYLSSAQGGELTGYRTGVTFGAADREVTFGRHTTSDGKVDFTAQSAATYGSANAYPRVGPVVITELLYRPATNAFEFIELFNTAPTNVPLHDPAYPTNTWKLEGAVEFTFPSGLSLDPGQLILITETDAATFRSAYTVPAGVTVLGPYDGKLDNAGETVWVTRPGEPKAATGEVPYILEELVDYDNTTPWPTNANTGGVALVRVNTALYANDSANWTGHPPTPGTVAGVDPDADADGDGMPDSWEIAYFGSTNAVNGEAGDDWDGDIASNYG